MSTKKFFILSGALLFLSASGVHAAPNSSAPSMDSYFSSYPSGFPADPDQPLGVKILPHGRPFPSLPTDPRDLRIGLRKTNQHTMEADVGGYRSIVGWKGDVKGKATVLHAGIEGNAYFTMHQVGSRFPLESSDGMFGLYAEAAREGWFYQARFTHISAHLSDGSANVLQNIKYSREFLVLRLARQVSWFRPYAGPIILVHSIPVDVPTLGGQVGFYAIPRIKSGPFHPYFGADFRGRGGREGSTWNFSAGIALTSSLQAPPIRIAANYLTGHDLRGQFFDKKTKKFSAGLEMDF